MVRSAKHRLHATRTHTQTDTLNTYWHTDHQDPLGVDGPLGKAQVTRYTRTHTQTDTLNTFAVHSPMVWNSLLDDLLAQQDY